jgi:hypothetical protein
MICEKCGQECSTVTCSACGESILRLGLFCYLCGARLASENMENQPVEEQDDLSSRVLCSDGACIGVINEKGVCKVCGKPYTPES